MALHKGERTVTDTKLYLLADFLVKPEVLEETKRIFATLLPTVLEEEGCEAMYTTTVNDQPNRLVFFEVFSSEEAHAFHMGRDYTKQLAVDLEGKLLAPPVITRLSAF
jgi:quinol monooxygenase YgiN